MRNAVIRRAKCLKTDFNPFDWHLTVGNTYDVFKEFSDSETETQWIRVRADDGHPRNFRREWFS